MWSFWLLERRASRAPSLRSLNGRLQPEQDENGKSWRLDLKDLPAEEKAAVGFTQIGTQSLFDSMDANTLIEGMVPGSAVVALAIEHVWAVALVNAMYNAGMELATTYRVPAPIADEVYASLDTK